MLTREQAQKLYDVFPLKTPPLGKQREVVRNSWFEPIWALLCRPGTGKTKMALDTASLLYAHDRAQALLVVCPNEVHHQWINEGVPTHLSVPWTGGYFDSGMSATAIRRLQSKLTGDGLKILSISYDGMQTKDGLALIKDLLKRYTALGILDESHTCGNPTSGVYKAGKPILLRCRYRRIMTGTLLRQNPFSAWPQFEMLNHALLDHASYASFKKFHAEMLPEGHWLVQRQQAQFAAKTGRGIDKDDPKRYIPAILAKDENNMPIFKNLKILRDRLEVYSSFMDLKDVSGTEPVVLPSIRYVTLTKEQKEHYERLVKYGVADAPNGLLTAEGALALATRLAQCVGGFLPSNDDPTATAIGKVNPKMRALLAWLEEVGIGVKVVIWAKFMAELRLISDTLRATYGEQSTVEYHGLTSSKEKARAKEQFISDPRCTYFVGQQKAAGTGTDGLQAAASYMAFYSNDYPYLVRDQAQSRLARTGGADVVNIVDFMVEGTIDEDIVRCMQAAEDCHVQVLQRRIDSSR